MHAPGDWFWVVIAVAVTLSALRRTVRSRWGWFGAWGPPGGGWGRPELDVDVRQRREIEERQASQETYLQQLEIRVNELESRLDFTERLLAERRDPQLNSKG